MTHPLLGLTDEQIEKMKRSTVPNIYNTQLAWAIRAKDGQNYIILNPIHRQYHEDNGSIVAPCSTTYKRTADPQY